MKTKHNIFLPVKNLCLYECSSNSWCCELWMTPKIGSCHLWLWRLIMEKQLEFLWRFRAALPQRLLTVQPFKTIITPQANKAPGERSSAICSPCIFNPPEDGSRTLFWVGRVWKTQAWGHDPFMLHAITEEWFNRPMGKNTFDLANEPHRRALGRGLSSGNNHSTSSTSDAALTLKTFLRLLCY